MECNPECAVAKVTLSDDLVARESWIDSVVIDRTKRVCYTEVSEV
jgi:hypothetical protein